jgi:hypothetical protein
MTRKPELILLNAIHDICNQFAQWDCLEGAEKFFEDVKKTVVCSM